MSYIYCVSGDLLPLLDLTCPTLIGGGCLSSNNMSESALWGVRFPNGVCFPEEGGGLGISQERLFTAVSGYGLLGRLELS